MQFFNGTGESREAPSTRSAQDQWQALEEYQNWLTQQRGYHADIDSSVPHRRSRLRTETTVSPDPSKIHGIKRESVFSSLPYWEVRIHRQFWEIDSQLCSVICSLRSQLLKVRRLLFSSTE